MLTWKFYAKDINWLFNNDRDILECGYKFNPIINKDNLGNLEFWYRYDLVAYLLGQLWIFR